jgi:hypothetical protein
MDQTFPLNNNTPQNQQLIQPIPVANLVEALQQRQDEEDESIKVSPIIMRRRRQQRQRPIISGPDEGIENTRSSVLQAPPPQTVRRAPSNLVAQFTVREAPDSVFASNSQSGPSSSKSKGKSRVIE